MFSKGKAYILEDVGACKEVTCKNASQPGPVIAPCQRTDEPTEKPNGTGITLVAGAVSWLPCLTTGGHQ
jgi:hypothetical protein